MQKAYVGVNNVAQNVKNIYVGVNGVAHKVVKGYIGVNGVARQFWGGGAVQTPSWNYWSSVSGKKLSLYDINSGNEAIEIRKYANKIAYFAWIKINVGGQTAYSPLFISPDQDAVTYDDYRISSGQTGRYYYRGTITDANGITWYWNTIIARYSAGYYDIDNEYLLNNTVYPTEDSHGNINSQPAQDLLDMIYAVPFHENYQIGQTYSVSLADAEKALRKVFGVFLFRYISRTEAAYTNFSDNIDATITDALTQIGSGDKMVDVYIQTAWNGSRSYINCITYYTNSIASQFTVNNHSISNGYDYFNVSLDNTYTFAARRAYASASGVSYDTVSSESKNTSTVGINTNGIRSSNIGIDL